MIDSIKRKMGFGRTHENVNRIFMSNYFNRPIVVTAFISDTCWKFRFYGEEREFNAQSKLGYLIENGMERKDLKWDNMNKLKQYR